MDTVIRGFTAECGDNQDESALRRQLSAGGKENEQAAD